MFNTLYKLFCIPKKGIHTHRIFGYSTIDLIFSILFCYYLNKYFNISIIYLFTSYYLIGEIIHHILGINTHFYIILKKLIKSYIYTQKNKK